MWSFLTRERRKLGRGVLAFDDFPGAAHLHQPATMGQKRNCLSIHFNARSWPWAALCPSNKLTQATWS